MIGPIAYPMVQPGIHFAASPGFHCRSCGKCCSEPEDRRINPARWVDAAMKRNSAARLGVEASTLRANANNSCEATSDELFVPSSTGMIPTEYAETLWPTVRASLDSLHDAFEPDEFDPRVDARSFTLAMADATAALFVPVLVNTLRREHAQVELRLVPLITRDPRGMLEQGQTDIALGFFPEVSAALASEGDDSAVRLESLYGCEYVCVMRHDHPLAQDGALTLDAYCAADHLRVSFAGRPWGFVDEALSGLGRQRRVMITVNQFFTAGSVVHQSDLLTVLPRSFVPATGFESQLSMRALPFELPGIEVSLLWHRRHEQDAAQRWLRNALVEAATEIAKRLQASC